MGSHPASLPSTTDIHVPATESRIERDLQGLATIWRRELLHVWRDKPRLVGSLIQPLLFLLIIGNGLAPAVGNAIGGIDFKKFIFPGIIAMSVLFSSVFYGITVVWDREFGFLKEILAAPVRRYVVALGKILAGSTIATTQGLIVLMFVPWLAETSLSASVVVKLIPFLFLLSLVTSSLGVTLGAIIKSIQAFQVMMMVLVMPLYFLSGAFFPLKDLPTWMDILSKIDPLTYGVDPIRQIGLTAVLRSHSIQVFAVHTIGFDVLMLCVFAAILITWSITVFNRL
ncbi:MAG: ABC transporter permease [Chloroflexi bacterium]|nr:ABC transporter permease [Chloroflexota bacterium]